MLANFRAANAGRARAAVFLLLAFAAAFAQEQKAPAEPAPGGAARAEVPSTKPAAPPLLETGRAAKTRAAEAAPDKLKVVSYNIRFRVGGDLERLVELLSRDAEVGGAHLIGLQEVDRNKGRTRNVNTVRLMAEALGMHYAWAAPPAPPDDDPEPEEEETGVAVLSLYPLEDVERIVLPHEGPGGRRRVALGATVSIGGRPLRFYSVHGETRIKMERRVEQLKAVLEDLGRRPSVERAVVLGDFNTIKGRDVRACVKLFTDSGFTSPIPHDRSTFKVFLLKFKLDWIWARGLEPVDGGIDRDIGLSDHWPLWATFKLDGGRKTTDPAASSR